MASTLLMPISHTKVRVSCSIGAYLSLQKACMPEARLRQERLTLACRCRPALRSKRFGHTGESSDCKRKDAYELNKVLWTSTKL